MPKFRDSACPQGGTWKHLLSIAELIKKLYVLQLDSDTLTVAVVPQVAQCVAEALSFPICTWYEQCFVTMAERVAHARTLPDGKGTHVQVVAEAHFDHRRDFDRLNHVRACSGLAGYAPGAFTREFVESISRQMSAAIGTRWPEWDGEQVMPNILLANAPSAAVLPHPKYAECRKCSRTESPSSTSPAAAVSAALSLRG